ncbi:MAG TPA: L,D-transpeptidase [Polyangia bacterium]|nr:L,D-transpeptidase [Polyangia bacterium]
MFAAIGAASGPATTRATPPTPAAKAAVVAQAATSSAAIPIVDGGRVVGQTTADDARRDGLTVVDLSDDWLPYVFSEEPGKPQPLRPYLIDLANGRFRPNKAYARAREDRTFEAFGVFPSVNLVRRRLADRKRHVCHDRVKDDALEKMPPKSVIVPEEPEKTPNPNPLAPGAPVPPAGASAAGEAPKPSSPEPPTAGAPAAAANGPTATTEKPPRKPLSPAEQRAVIAMQAHLRCEDLLPAKAKPGRMDRRTVAGLQIYQRLNMLADHGRIDLETRTALLGDSREHDFRALLRALRERVVDATGLLEDGSALGVQSEVQGRVLDSAEFRPLPMQPAAAPPPSPPPPAPAQGTPATPAAGAVAAVKIVPAPDLIGAATQAASQALGWTSPDAVVASALALPPAPASGGQKPKRKARAPKGPVPLPVAVALRLPPLPPYHGPQMQLRAEIDRGEVVLAKPELDKDGRKKWKPPVADRPTLTLYARVGDHEVALMRWPTTIGGWKAIQKSDGTMALKYRESITGDAVWPQVLATPTWHPFAGLPTRHLLIKRGDTWEPKTEIIGPGYRAAYGLVAIVHKQIMGVNERGEQQLEDLRIRTHGTPAYRSVKRGESSGCHRLHNQLALRLAGFLVKHRANVRQGLVPEDYVRHLEYQGQQVALESGSKGYGFALTPPVPVTVLDGDVRGDAKAVKRLVPLAAVP